MAKCIGTVKINTRLGFVFAPAYAIGKNFAVTAHLISFDGETPVFAEDCFHVTHIHSGYALDNENATKYTSESQIIIRLTRNPRLRRILGVIDEREDRYVVWDGVCYACGNTT